MKKIILTFLIASIFPLMIYSQGVRHNDSGDSIITKTQTHDAKLLFLSPIFSMPLALYSDIDNYPKSLHLQFGSSDEELKTLRSILGSVQLGSVAYLAYRHIKKYGLK